MSTPLVTVAAAVHVAFGAGCAVGGREKRDHVEHTVARVGPNEKRMLTTGEEGAVILALGGVPGQAYEVWQPTEEGEPDPFAQSG